MTQPPRIQAGTTRLFSVQYSGNPTAAPRFTVTCDSAEITVFSSQATSATTAYAFQQQFTMPVGSAGVYAFDWTAAFSVSGGTIPDVTRGLFQVIHRAPWTR